MNSMLGTRLNGVAAQTEDRSVSAVDSFRDNLSNFFTSGSEPDDDRDKSAVPTPEAGPSTAPQPTSVEDANDADELHKFSGVKIEESSSSGIDMLASQAENDLPIHPEYGQAVSHYKVFVNAAEDLEDHLVIMQFPNRGRHQPYSEAVGQKPTAVRLKPKSGLMEIDVPIFTQFNYDINRGETFAEALKRAGINPEGGPYGLAGGFGVGRTRPRTADDEDEEGDEEYDSQEDGGDEETGDEEEGGGEKQEDGEEDDANEEDDSEEDDDENDEETSGSTEGDDTDDEDDEDGDVEMAEASEGEGKGKGKAKEHNPILRHITLGGKLEYPQDHDPNYFIGVFKGNELHLTRLHAFITIRPVHHHVNAKRLVFEDTWNELQAQKSSREKEQTQESEAQAVNMTAESADDEEEIESTDIGKSLRAIADERWVEGQWIDEEDMEAYKAYGDSLFYCGDYHKNAPMISAATNQQYLDAIFHMEDPNDPRRKRLVSHNYTVEGDPHFDSGESMIGEGEEQNSSSGETGEDSSEEGSSKTGSESGDDSEDTDSDESHAGKTVDEA
ncbi:MAG: hypothetical protein MMC33_009197 [Icmadophila ericetorum]|nr:hypothetical protein [Icmadophila ericetorum]